MDSGPDLVPGRILSEKERLDPLVWALISSAKKGAVFTKWLCGHSCETERGRESTHFPLPWEGGKKRKQMMVLRTMMKE